MPGAGPTIWAGDRVIVWGRVTSISPSTGWSYDPDSDSWAPLPEAPVQATPGASAVWTGNEVIYWGRNPEGAGPRAGTASGVAYDPALQTWRLLPEAPIPDRTEHQGMWTGKEMVVWGGTTGNWRPHEGVLQAGSAAAYDPRADSWRALTDVPEPWSGDGPGVLTVVHDGRVFIYRGGQVVRLDSSTGEWRPFGDPKPVPPPVVNCGRHSIGVEWMTGGVNSGELFIWTDNCRSYPGYAISLDSGQWRSLSTAPFSEHPSEMAAGGGGLYTAADSGGQVEVFRYDVDEDSWDELEREGIDIALFPRLVWTGRELLAMNGFRVDNQPRPGAAFRPE